MRIGDRLKPVIPPMEPGTYMGVCIGIVDLGEQLITFKDKTSPKEQIMFVIEFPTELIEVEGEMKPRQLSKACSRTVNERGSLISLISGWTGRTFTPDELKDFDTDELLMQPCMVTVALSASGSYANISSIVQFPKGFPAPVSNTVPYTFEIDKWDDEKFAALPEWIQDKIKKSTQYQKEHAPDTVIEVVNTDTGEVCPI